MSGEVERSKLVKLADDILRLSPEERNQLFNIIKLDKLDKFSQENFEKIIMNSSHIIGKKLVPVSSIGYVTRMSPFINDEVLSKNNVDEEIEFKREWVFHNELLDEDRKVPDILLLDTIDSNHPDYNKVYNKFRVSQGLPRITLEIGKVYLVRLGGRNGPPIYRRKILSNIIENGNFPDLYFEDEEVRTLSNKNKCGMNLNINKVINQIIDPEPKPKIIPKDGGLQWP